MMKKLLLLMMLFQGCGERFYMSNMLGEDNVDITKFVKEGYKPAYCDGKIYKLVKASPEFDLKKHAYKLDIEIKGWLKESGSNENFVIKDADRDILYRYSYLLSDHPIDVYTVKIHISEKPVVLFFRKDIDTILGPLNSLGWIFSKCDNDEKAAQ